MLRRLVLLLLLVGLVAVGISVWRARSGSSPTVAETIRAGGGEARSLGAEVREKLGAIGEEWQDAKVTGSVKTALSLNRNLRSSSIEVASDDGVVTLRGRVDSEEARARAEALAAEVPGVKQVVNQLQATAAAPSGVGRTLGESLDDQALEVQVRLALSLNRELAGTDLTVGSYRREVTLGGEVASLAQRDSALRTARETGSVSSVVDRLHVRASAEAPRPTPSSAERVAAAQRALKANPNLGAFDLRVGEESGRLVLRGVVHTSVEKDLAGVLAREAAGGVVDNAVEVRAGV